MQMQRENDFEKMVAENITIQFEKQEGVRNIIFERVKQEFEDFKEYRHKLDLQLSDLFALMRTKDQDRKDYVDSVINDRIMAIDYMNLNEKYNTIDEIKT